MVVGRWANLVSCRKYLKIGEALVARLLAAQSVKLVARLHAMAMDLEELFS